MVAVVFLCRRSSSSSPCRLPRQLAIMLNSAFLSRASRKHIQRCLRPEIAGGKAFQLYVIGPRAHRATPAAMLEFWTIRMSIARWEVGLGVDILAENAAAYRRAACEWDAWLSACAPEHNAPR